MGLNHAGEIPQRQELNDLSDEQKFLYLEGLKRFQEVSNDDPLSYYQIAGKRDHRHFESFLY